MVYRVHPPETTRPTTWTTFGVRLCNLCPDGRSNDSDVEQCGQTVELRSCDDGGRTPQGDGNLNDLLTSFNQGCCFGSDTRWSPYSHCSDRDGIDTPQCLCQHVPLKIMLGVFLRGGGGGYLHLVALDSTDKADRSGAQVLEQ